METALWILAIVAVLQFIGGIFNGLSEIAQREQARKEILRIAEETRKSRDEFEKRIGEIAKAGISGAPMPPSSDPARPICPKCMTPIHPVEPSVIVGGQIIHLRCRDNASN